MRIVQVIPTLDPRTGGPPMVVLNLAAALAKSHDVDVVSFESTDARATVDKVIDATPGADAVQFHRLSPSKRLQRIYATDMVEALEQLAGKPDVVHLHGLWELAILNAGRAAGRLSIPYAIAPHGMLDPWSLSQKKLKKQIALALVYRKMINGAAVIHALNPTERDLFEPLQLKPRVEVVPNGFNLEELRPLPEPGVFRKTQPALGDRPFFLFMSRLHYKKGLDLLAEAFVAFRQGGGQWNLVIAGPDDGARADFERQIAEYGLGEHVHVVGPIYGRDKLGALCDASGFVLPSRQEGFSVAITEALACGLPVIVTHDCHFPEVAEVNAGWVIDFDKQQLTHALVQLSQAGDEAKAMGRRGRAMVEERFTWDAVAEQMTAMYQRMLS